MTGFAEGTAHQLVVVHEPIERAVHLFVAAGRRGLVQHRLQPDVLVLDESLRVLGTRGRCERKQSDGRDQGEDMAESRDGRHDGWLFASEWVPLQVSMQATPGRWWVVVGLDGDAAGPIQSTRLSGT